VYLWLTGVYATRRELLIAGLMRCVFTAIVVTALASLWRAAAEGGPIHGYDTRDLVWYIAFTEIAITSTPSQLMVDVAYRIRDGDVAVMLTKPITAAWYIVAEGLGQSLAQLMLVVPVASLVAFALVGAPPAGAMLLTLLVTLPLALALQIVMAVLLAGGTFWLGDSRAIWFLHQKIVMLVGGMLIPLEMLPAPADTITPLLPWAGMAYIPAHSAIAGSLADFATGLLFQIGWLAVLGIVMVRVFHRGQRQMAVGGG
jgi:ABC-2 type transport system permease protein